MHNVVKKLIGAGVTRLGDNFQHVSAHVDAEVLSWPGGSLIAVLLLLCASVRSKCLTGRRCPRASPASDAQRYIAASRCIEASRPLKNWISHRGGEFPR
jgi:hypothetical protein